MKRVIHSCLYTRSAAIKRGEIVPVLCKNSNRGYYNFIPDTEQEMPAVGSSKVSLVVRAWDLVMTVIEEGKGIT